MVTSESTCLGSYVINQKKGSWREILSGDVSNSLGINLFQHTLEPVSYTHLRAHETLRYLVCRLLIPKDIVGNVRAEVFCDGKKVDHDISSIEDSWLLHFNYIGDVDEVIISSNAASTPFEIPNIDLLPLLLFLSVIVLCGIVIYFSRRKR